MAWLKIVAGVVLVLVVSSSLVRGSPAKKGRGISKVKVSTTSAPPPPPPSPVLIEDEDKDDPTTTTSAGTSSSPPAPVSLTDSICNFRPIWDKTPTGAWCELESENLDTLVTTAVIFRHGARTPMYKYVFDPFQDFDYGIEGLGQLTGPGKHWSYRLGQYLRCRYGSFLSTRYSMSQVYCRSSQTDRTAMSAASLLAGLFPPLRRDPGGHVDFPKVRWQPIPCFTIDQQLDNKLKNTRSCPKYDALFSEHLAKLGATLDRNTIKLLRNLSDLTGNDVQSYKDVHNIMDTLSIQHCQYGLPFPAWFPPLAKQIQALEQANYLQFVSTGELQRLFVGPILHQIILDLETMLGFDDFGLSEMTAEELASLRRANLYIYATHDTTISGLLESLGGYNSTQPPPYDAALIFELHHDEDEEGQGVNWVKILYRTDPNGVAEEVLLSNCDQPCTLSKFKEITSNLRVDDKKWDSLCGNAKCSDGNDNNSDDDNDDENDD